MKHSIRQENKSISVEQMCFSGKDITDKKEIVESFNEHFVTVGEKTCKTNTMKQCLADYWAHSQIIFEIRVSAYHWGSSFDNNY